MSDIDWRGIALAINQLAQIAEPSKMDLLEREEQIRASREKKDRAFDTAKFKFETMYQEHRDLEEQIANKESEINEINTLALNLVDKDPILTSGNIYDILDDLDMNNLATLNNSSEDLSTSLQKQISYLGQISNLHSNMLFGKQLRESEGAIRKVYKLDDGTYTNEGNEGASEYGWDIDNNTFVNETELESVLNETIKFLQSEAGENYDTTGIKEGFWDGYEGQSERSSDEIDSQEDILDYDTKVQNIINDSSGGVDISDGQKDIMKKELKTLIEEGDYDPEFAQWLVSTNLGDNDLLVMSEQFLTTQASLAEFREGKGEIWDFIETNYNRFIDNPNVSAENRNNYKQHGIIRGFEISYGVPEGSKDVTAALSRGNIPIGELTAYEEAIKQYNQLVKTQTEMFSTFLSEDKMHFITDIKMEDKVTWDSLNNIGFDKDFYSYLKNEEWLPGSPQRSRVLGIQLKEEFEWLAKNSQKYQDGKLNYADKAQFEELILNFHKLNPAYFQEKFKNFEILYPDMDEKIKEQIKKDIDIYGSTTQ